jgi:ankyrin repeat protein
MLQRALASLPETLDDTYARILCNIDREYSQDALKILQWLAYSAQPLRIEEVVEVIAVDVEGDPRFNPERRLPEQQDILTICSSLVTTATVTMEAFEGETSIEVRLAHFSVKEYLVSARVQCGPAAGYTIQEISANMSIAEICLAYLLQFDKPDSLTSQTIEEFPLARYAARYWTQHSRAAGENAGAVGLLGLELLSQRDAFVNWIRLFNPDKPWEQPDVVKSSESVCSPLYYAAQTGLIDFTGLLLDRGADVNANGGSYSTALQAAAIRGHDQIVQLLLDRGADVNANGGSYGTALQAAANRGHDQIVQLLLDRGADVNVNSGSYGTALQAAASKGHDQIVQLLLDWDADVNANGGYYGTALQAAASKGHDQIVQLLLDRGADVNVNGGHYGTALQAAASKGHDQIVQLLLDRGADVNVNGGHYCTALQAAAVKGHDWIVQLLLDRGADVNANDGGNYGIALQAAAGRGHDRIVQLLLDRGAKEL